MKRAVISLAILLIGLGSLVVAAGAESHLPSNVVTMPAGQATHHLMGYAGKIIAVKPPGDWTKAGPAGKSAPFGPLFPSVLPVFGTDVNIMPSNETFIASDPQNPLYFISGSNAVARAFTSNGGQTWTTTSPSGIGDPVGTYDNANNAYFGQLSTGTCPDPAVVSRSSNGGATWGSQITALSDASPTDHFIDKPWMEADRYPSSPFYGRVYVSGTSFYAPGCNLGAYVNAREVLAFSTNQGASWSASATVSDASHDQVQFTDPIVANNGTLYVSYQYQNCTYNCTSSIPMVQLITKSTDGGVTFSPGITMTGQPITPTGAFSGGYQYLYASSTASGFRHNDQAIIGVSPTNPQHVYAVWTDGRFESSFVYQSITGQHADIVFTRSTDGGNTWSPVVKVNDDNVQGKDQFFPWMTVGSDGTIHVSWMDRREAAVSGFPYREYYSQSTDEGQTWSLNQPVGDVTNTPGSFIGDYAGIAVSSDNSRVLPVWTDQRSGQRVFTDPGLLVGGTTPTATSTALAATNTPTNIPSSTATSGVSATSTSTTAPSTPTGTSTSSASTSTATRTTAPTSAVGSATSTSTVTAGTPAATSTPGTPTATYTACPVQFTDVPNGSTFYPYIRCLACRGIVSGYQDGTFRPNNNVTRGQLSKIVANSAGFSETHTTQDFQDVPVGSNFYIWIERLYSRGIIGGYPCGGPFEPCGPGNLPYFRPNANATRGQITKIDANAAGYSDPPVGQQFQDVAPGSTFYTYTYQLVTRGIMSGYPCSGPGEPCVPPGNLPYFRPNNNATRGQTAKIVANTFFPNCQTPSTGLERKK